MVSDQRQQKIPDESNDEQVSPFQVLIYSSLNQIVKYWILSLFTCQDKTLRYESKHKFREEK